MKKNRNTSKVIIVIAFILLIVVFVDYNNTKRIPNFFFSNSFSHENTAVYWGGVGTLLLALPAIIKIVLDQKEKEESKQKMVSDKNGKEFESIKLNANTAISKLSVENNAQQNLTFIKDIQTAIDYQLSRNNEKMLSANDLIISLSNFMHSQLKSTQSYNRLDTQNVFLYLFTTDNVIKHCVEHKLAVAEFNSERIDFEKISTEKSFRIHNAKMNNVTFNEKLENFIFLEFSSFEHCFFNETSKIKLENNQFLSFKNCEFNDFTKFDGIINPPEISNVNIENSKINSYFSMRESSLNNITIKNCSFVSSAVFSDMKVNSIIIEKCKFDGVFGMEQTTVETEMRLIKTTFKDGVILTKSIFKNKKYVSVLNSKIYKAPNLHISFRAEILDNDNKFDMSKGIIEVESNEDYFVYEYDEKLLSHNSSK